MAVGFPATLLAGALVLAVGGALLEARLPSGLDYLHPLRLLGAFEMGFDLVFLARDRAPGFFDFALSLAATGGVAAIGTLLVSVISRRIAGPLTLGLLFLALGMVASRPASALDLRLDQEVHIAADTTLQDSLVVTGDLLDVDGTIEGDVACFVERLVVRGKIDGNLYAASRSVEILGTVTGRVHMVGERLRIEGQVAGLIGGGDDFTLAEEGKIERDAVVFVENATFDGEVGRDLIFAGKAMVLRGKIGRDLDVLGAEQVRLRPTAVVGGSVEAKLPEDEEIEVAEEAQVGGELTTTRFDHTHQRRLESFARPAFYVVRLAQLGASLVFGLLLYVFFPRVYPTEAPTQLGFFRSVGRGFLFTIVTPIVLLLVCCTVLGIPLAVVGLFVYVTSLYLAHILVGALVGHVVLPNEDTALRAFGLRLLVGLLLLMVVSNIPWLGPIFAIVVVLFGMGLLLDRGAALRREFA